MLILCLLNVCIYSRVDPDQETEAQKAIDAFFSQNSIVPSPWSSGSKSKIVEYKCVFFVIEENSVFAH